MNDTEVILDTLRTLTADMLYMSETDAPWEVYLWEQPVETTFPPLSPVRVLTTEDFIAPILELGDSKEDALYKTQYKALLKGMEEFLTGLKVYRVGEIEIDIYIVGKTADGKQIGVKSLAVET